MPEGRERHEGADLERGKERRGTVSRVLFRDSVFPSSCAVPYLVLHVSRSVIRPLSQHPLSKERRSDLSLDGTDPFERRRLVMCYWCEDAVILGVIG